MTQAPRAAATALLCLCLAAGAAAQSGTPGPPPGDASVQVRLVHEAGPERVAGVEVILYSLSATGEPGLRRERTDDGGRVRFEGLSNDPHVVYLVGTRIDGVPFGSRFAFGKDEREREVEIAIAQPTRDVTALEPGGLRVRLEPGCGDLRIHQLHALENASGRVIHVPPEEREGAQPLLEVELPEGASEIETPLGAGEEGFERDGRRLRYWGPLYPGPQQLEFGYGVPFERAGELLLGLPGGATGVELLTPGDELEVRAEGFEPAGELPLPAGIYALRRRGPLAPGAGLALAIRGLPQAQPAAPGLSLAESQLWLELDDAALDVSEQHSLRQDGEEALAPRSAGPLLCLPLPPDAQDVRFGTASLELGLSRDPGGALAVRGPLPPGESVLSLRYRLPVRSEPVRFERRFELPVGLLTVLVADTGILPTSPRLHKRRPVRTEDRAFLHLEAFAIAPDESVELELEHLPRPGPTSTLASTGIVFGFALAALAFLAAPLGTSAPPEGEPPRESSAAIERQAVYEAIEALDEDFETGKLSSADHARMRDELRRRAVALLQAERDAQSAPRPATPSDCPQCQAKVRPGDRFCAQCGQRLGGNGSHGP